MSNLGQDLEPATPSPRGAASFDLTEWTVRQVANGVLASSIAESIHIAGLSRTANEASTFVAGVKSQWDQAVAKVKRRAAAKHLFWGLLAAGIGAGLSLATYSSASGGDTYFVFWGAVLYGGYRVIRGAALFLETLSR